MTDKLQDGIKDNADKISESDLLSNDAFNSKLDNLIIESFKIGRDRPQAFENDESIHLKLHRVAHQLANNYLEIRKSNSAAESALKSAKDYEKRYLTVKFKESLMAFGFRVATTLAIGFSIMLVYWVAHCLGVPMPLLRIPT